MKVRPITKDDLTDVLLLLCEGFPRRDPRYWQVALERLGQRPEVPGHPRYGLLIEDGGRAQGVLLTLSAEIPSLPGNGPAQRRCNHSSWYVREAYRKFAPFLLRAALRMEATLYTDLSPQTNVVPIITALGFRPYSGGVTLLDARSAFRPGGRVRSYDPARVDPGTRAVAEAHLGYGAEALLVGDEPSLALYRMRRLKGVLPAARFIFGTPERLIAHRGALMRRLALRGIPLALIDIRPGMTPAAGRVMPNREVRYARGGSPPEIGDLLETEIAVFGP